VEGASKTQVALQGGVPDLVPKTNLVICNARLFAAFASSLAFLLLLCGCASPQKPYAPSERPSFFESEIRSRKWTDPDGAEVRYLSATVTNFGAQGEIMIARFGDPNANQVRCLELYRVNRKADATLRDAYVLLDHDWGPREQVWWPSVVISVEPVVSPERITFRITRETLPGLGAERKRLLYFLDYRKGVGVRPNMSELWLAVPAGQ
jgi:hypothetical protein